MEELSDQPPSELDERIIKVRNEIAVRMRRINEREKEHFMPDLKESIYSE